MRAIASKLPYRVVKTMRDLLNSGNRAHTAVQLTWTVVPKA